MKVQGDKIRTKAEIKSSIRRIAYQIYENNIDEDVLVIIGIATRGNSLAKLLGKELEQCSSLKIVYAELEVNKEKPRDEIHCSIPIESVENKSIVIVDDVLNTGSTLIYAVNYFLKVPVKQIKTAVMVNRNHKKFPIKADFKGISLSTSSNEHVRVELEGADSGIYLN